MDLAVPLLLLALAAAIDLRRREVPDWVPVALLAWALLLLLAGAGPGGGRALAGLGLGAGVGLLAFWSGGFGGGDAKLVAALGPVLGPSALAWTLAFGALAGGVLSLHARLRGQRELAYAPALAAGLAVFLLVPEEWRSLAH